MFGEYACNLAVTIADRCTIQSSTCGRTLMKVTIEGKPTTTLLQEVHVISGLRKNLLSVYQIVKKGIYTSCTEHGASLWKLDDMGSRKGVGCAMWDNELCYINGHAMRSAVASIVAKPNDSI